MKLADRAFDTRIAARTARRRHVLCIGDSHVCAFDHVRMPGVWLRTFLVEGATASGIVNPHSVTGAFPLFTQRLARARPWQHVVVCLGEVDCGFVIWLRSQRHGLSVQEQLEATLASYCLFLERVKGFASLSVLSAPLPTISDDPCERGEVANLRKEITATQQERTDLTLRFTSVQRQRVTRLGIGFIDATSSQIDLDTGMIDERLVRSQLDHHLRDEPYAELLAMACGTASWARPRRPGVARPILGSTLQKRV